MQSGLGFSEATGCLNLKKPDFSRRAGFASAPPIWN
jgi:hypothetical protein